MKFTVWLEVPPGVVTVTLAGPAVPGGEVTVIEVAELTTTDVPAVPPKLTVAPATKLVPVMVTEVPPVVGPAVELMDVTVGAAS